jgi:glutathionylspermidine synthase
MIGEMKMNEQAIPYYHELVSNTDTVTLAEVSARFVSDLRAHKACYGERPLSTFLRPKFITPQQRDLISHACRILREAVVKVKEAIFARKDCYEQIGLSEGERMLCEIDPGFSRLSITSRWDSFMTETAEGNILLKFVELNADSPAGIAYNDVMSDIYLRLPFMVEFRRRYNVQPFAIRAILLRQLLDTYKEWSGNKSGRKVPHIGIIDWRGVSTWPEFELMQEYFESQGVPTILADPRELDYVTGKSRRGWLCKDNFEIDLIYKRVVTNEFLEKLDEVQAMFAAVQNRDVCLINPFRAKLVHKKSLFAILTHERNQHLFDPDEQQIIHEHIPWTRKIEPCKTVYQGREIDLCEYIARHKDNFVIKPNDEYGGKGVTLGWETSAEQWERLIKDALNDFYVVQEKVPIARESFPYFDGGLRFADLVVDLDPYVFGPVVGGILTRLSASSLANVTVGGGSTSTFLISPK